MRKLKKKKIISLKDPEKEIVLKRCFIDELGYQIFKGNGFEPQYSYFKNKDTLDIRVEVPGSVEIPKVGKAIYLGDCTHIKIYGTKKRDKLPENLDDNIENKRDFGEFSIDISFKTEEFKIKSEPKEQKIKNGILYIKYELEEDKAEESGSPLVVEDEDE
jgi:HSP20 family molecular chaperone IbpA